MFPRLALAKPNNFIYKDLTLNEENSPEALESGVHPLHVVQLRAVRGSHLMKVTDPSDELIQLVTCPRRFYSILSASLERSSDLHLSFLPSSLPFSRSLSLSLSRCLILLFCTNSAAVCQNHNYHLRQYLMQDSHMRF